MAQGMLVRAKETLRHRAPGVFAVLRDIKNRIQIEYRVLRHLSMRDLLRPLAGPSAWREALPLQRPTQVASPISLGDELHALLGRLSELGHVWRSGAHSVYLPPDSFHAGPLAGLAASYPPTAGFKLAKQPGTADSAFGLVGDQHSRLQRQLLHSHRHLTLVANLLHASNLGPRLYDLVEVRDGSNTFTGYVVEDVATRAPEMEEHRAGMKALRHLTQEGMLSIVAPGGLAHSDFRAPDCAGNAWIDTQGNFSFVDWQNFTLQDYGSYLRSIAEAGAAATHFGDRSLLRGGAYLYQAVPATGLPAKRDPKARMLVIEDLLRSAGVGLEARTVFDVGCNLGMMMGQYLHLGASWVHGWDQPAVVPHSERLLLALGCTRFSLTGGQIGRDKNFFLDLPPHARARSSGSVLSYLAVRRHLGWLPGLWELPWSILIYEGHEGEDETASRAYLAEAEHEGKARLSGLATYRDGDSDPRVVAVLVR